MDQKARRNFSLISLRRQYTHPHELYDALRAHDAIYFDTLSNSWMITGYAAARYILDHPRFSSALGTQSDTLVPSIKKQMLFMDGEKHKRTQRTMLQSLTQLTKKIPQVLQSVAQNTLISLGEKGEMDLVSEFASIISLQAIAHILGIPTSDLDELLHLERWSDTFADLTTGYFRGNIRDVEQLEDYFRKLIACKRRNPANDLLSAFIAADEIFPEEEDLIANCIMVFGAGRVTTKKVLGNGVPLLLDQWKMLHQQFHNNPQGLTKLLVEELIRQVTPTRCLMRQALEDIDLSGQFAGNHSIPKGSCMLIFLEAANYDPAEFVNPHQFDHQRKPNRHIAFGYGSHKCPGAPLHAWNYRLP